MELELIDENGRNDIDRWDRPRRGLERSEGLEVHIVGNVLFDFCTDLLQV